MIQIHRIIDEICGVINAVVGKLKFILGFIRNKSGLIVLSINWVVDSYKNLYFSTSLPLHENTSKRL